MRRRRSRLDLIYDEASGLTSNQPALRNALIALLPELRGYARFLVRDRSAADDLVQDALVRALAALGQFAEGSNLRAWLFTILRHVFLEQRRRYAVERRALERTPPPEQHDAAPQHGQAALGELQRFLWKLSPALREALVLVGAQGLGYDEAAAICAVPVGTMKARVSRARSQLAAAMRDTTPIAK